MQYLITLNVPPYEAPRAGEPGFEERIAPWVEFHQTFGDALVAGGELQPRETATTVRRSADGDTIVDGPFQETKEALAGFYLVEAPDLDAVLAVVTALPLPGGAFEVRPLAAGMAR
ncbi:YciI family protein [Microbacterium sp. X-17]|uniref:YciI family protein n=1 Tax=Microbacterium sp. X-17 TaxID=3144404 RepID=UPI0031F5993A